jgi:hypothetical protein
MTKTGVAFFGTAAFTVTFSNLPDAALLSDSRMTWFLNNGWERYTYYTLAKATKLNPTSTCNAAGEAGCLKVTDLPASNGNTNDKRFVLTLLGRALSTQTQPSATIANYLESHAVDGTDFLSLISTTSNDRLATCPFKRTTSIDFLNFIDTVICN